jgi:hypothetical protein
MIPEELRSRMRRLFFAEHWKVGTIAAELGVHHDTVALAIEAPRFVNIKYRALASVLDPYKSLIVSPRPGPSDQFRRAGYTARA